MKPPHNLSRRPVIAVTPDISNASAENPHSKFELKTAYCDALFRAGALPLIVPFNNDKSIIDAYLERVAGIVISGGAFDVPCETYGASPSERMGPTKPERTAFETTLIRGALHRKLPILGICGGMQLINVLYEGGTLIQDIVQEWPKAHSHQQMHDRSQPQHPIEVRDSTMLADAVGRGQLMVNSTHHQAIGKLGTGLTISATSSDGVIEAIETKLDGQFVMGVQWHPEMMLETLPVHLSIYKMLVTKARERRH